MTFEGFQSINISDYMRMMLFNVVAFPSTLNSQLQDIGCYQPLSDQLTTGMKKKYPNAHFTHLKI